jgi:uncharacterized protein YcgL (UPF0745 family)
VILNCFDMLMPKINFKKWKKNMIFMYFQAKKHFKKQPLQHFQTPPKSMMLGVGQKKMIKRSNWEIKKILQKTL